MLRILIAISLYLLAPLADAEWVSWNNAGFKAIGTNFNCIVGNAETLSAAYAGNSIHESEALLAVGEVFYAHLIFVQLGNTCVPNAVVLDFSLPSGIELAVSNDDPVFCLGLLPPNSSSPQSRLINYANDPDYGCPQSFSTGPNGYRLSAPRGGYGGGTWGTMRGVWLEFMIPVKATRILQANTRISFRVNPQIGVYDTVSTYPLLANGDRIFRSALEGIVLPVELCQSQDPIVGC
jgi:hypothetical protein